MSSMKSVMGVGRDRRGVALPLALLSLLSVSVLITGLVMTSTSEVVLSHAYQDATAGLYAADGAMESYLASLGDAVPGLGTHTMTLPDGRAVNVAVARLRDHQVMDGTVRVDSQIYSLTATPATRSGRTIAALFDRVVRTPQGTPPGNPPLQIGLKAAATFGSDLFINGNVTISGIHRRDCDGNPAVLDTVNAIRFVDGAGITNTPNQHVMDRIKENGGIDWYSFGRDSLVIKTLGVDSLAVLANVADVKFGARLGAEPFNSSMNPSSSQPREHKYNWGCAPGRPNCGQSGPYAKFIGIDAQGGTVVINGNGDGHGMLVIINGNLRISGTFVYHGLVAVEGSTSITGTADIYGGLLSVGLVSVEDNQVSNGTPIVKYDKCLLDAIQHEFENRPVPPGQAPPTAPTVEIARRLGWSELVR